MAESLGQAVLDLSTRDGGFRRGVSQADRAGRRLGRRFDQVARRIGAAGERISALGDRLVTRVSLPIALLGANAIRLASDVEESMNLLSVVFEDATDDVLAWSEATAEATNRAATEVAKVAGNFGALLSALEVAPELGVTLSKAMAQLVIDIASFRNVSEEAARTALFSGLVGEAEAVRRFGVDLSAAAVEAEALRLGLIGSNEEATQAQKVMARASLLVQQTADAQGDAQRTAGSFANQLRGLQAQFIATSVEIGQVFLPVATRVVSGMGNMARAFRELGTEAQSSILKLAGFALVGPVVLSVMGRIVRLVSAVAIGLKTVGVAVASVPALIVGMIGTVGVALAAFGRAILQFFAALGPLMLDAVEAVFRNNVTIPIQNALNGALEAIEALPFVEALPRIEVSDVIEPDFEGEFARVFNDATAQALNDIRNLKQGGRDLIAGLVEDAKGVLPDGLMGVLFPPDTSEESIDTTSIFDDLLAKLQAASTAASQAIEETGKSAADSTEQAAQGLTKMELIASQLESRLSSAFESAIFGAQSFKDTLVGLIDEIGRVILRVAVIDQISSAIVGGVQGFFSPAEREHGGRFNAGGPLLVGEGGPELLIPDSAGRVIPNGGIGGGVTVNVVNRGQPMDVESTRERQGANGEQIVDVMVRSSLSRMARSGELDPVLEPFGVRRRGQF